MINFYKNNKKIIFFLILIVLFGFIIRFYKLTTLPLPPNGDELAYGYYGYSLLHFGTDEYGNSFPIYFPSIGDYKYPALSYLNIIPSAIFGLSEITVRFWSSISGVVLIILVFILSYQIFSNFKVALFSAFFASITPWSIALSRSAHEVMVGIVFSTLAIILLIQASKIKENETKRKNRLSIKLLILSTLSFIISAFTYGSQRVFIPSVLLGVLLLSFGKKTVLANIRNRLVLAFIFLTIFIGVSLIPWESRGRASGVVWKGATREELEKNIFYDGISSIRTPLTITRIYHNKITSFFLETSLRYINHFNPSFLFFEGDRSPDKIPGVGIALHIELILFFAGVLGVWKLKNKGYINILFIWLLAGPTAAAITEGGPHFFRASNMYPALTTFSGFGLYYILSSIRKTKIKVPVIILISLLMILDVSYSLHQIYVHKPVDKPWYSDQGKKELVSEILAKKDKYKAVVMKEDPYIFFLFYGKITPKDFLTNSEILSESRQTQWERVKRVYNIHFGMPFDCPKGGKLNVLYICKGSEVPQNAKVLKVIYFLDGIPAYTFIEFFPISEIPQKQEKLAQMLKYMKEQETKFKDGIIPEDYPSYW